MKNKNLSISQVCLLMIIVGICLSLVGCEKHDVSHDVVGYVEGIVIDSLTRQPIDSAWISQTPDTTFEPLILTDSSGYYFIAQFPGIHQMFYSGKKGYVTKKSKEFEIKVNKTTRVDFELMPQKE
jgi:hypothetical protein